MEDKLKQFVDKHRGEFDRFEPRDEIWEDLEKKLDRQTQPKVIAFYQRPVWRYAAAVVLLVGLGFALIQYGRHLGQEGTTAATQIPLEKIAPEMAQVESYYVSIINEKKRERSAFDLEQMGLENDFRGEMARLDSAYAQLKQELYTNPNKQKVMDAMVQNLQVRIGILNQQLEVLKRIKQVKTTPRHEKITI